MTIENLVQIVWTVFEKNGKKLKNGCFWANFGHFWANFGHFGLILAMFLTFQSYDFDAFEHTGAPLGVE